MAFCIKILQAEEVGLGWQALYWPLYIVLYWFPKYLGLGQDGNTNSGIIGFDPLSFVLNGSCKSMVCVWYTYTIAI
jgi:hypothetical protein